MDFKIEYEQEEDGKWIAEIPSMPGVMIYGNSTDDATTKVKALLLNVLAEKLETKEISSDLKTVTF